VLSFSHVVGFELNGILLKAILSSQDNHLNRKSNNNTNENDSSESSLRSNQSVSISRQKTTTSKQSKQSKTSHIVGSVIIILKWNGLMATKTTSIAPKTSMLWSDLNIYFKVDNMNLDENELQIEIWDLKPNGDNGINYGILSFTGLELLQYINSVSISQSSSMSQASVSSLSSTPSSSWLSITDKGDQRSLTNLNMRLEMSVITAEMMSSKHIREEFNVGMKTRGVRGSSSANLSTDTLERCEINLICARDLLNTKSNTFVIIFFNSEEIGRSSVVYNTSSPTWCDETFEIMVPTSSSIEGCMLQIDMYHLEQDTSREIMIGHVKITGNMLPNFLLNSKIKYQWFDLLEIDSSEAHGQPWPIHGELKLSGRPIHVQFRGDEDDAIEMPMIDLHILSFFNLNSLLLSTELYVYAEVFFNNRKIYRTNLIEMIKNEIYIKEHMTFRLSNSLTLFQSILRLELFHVNSVGTLESIDCIVGALVATVQITGSALSKFIGEKGMITKRFPLQVTVIDNRNITIDNNNLIPIAIPEVELRGGRVGEKDIYEEQENELWFDVLAATNLPCRSQKMNLEDRKNDYRPNIFCEVSWNKLKIGKSSVINSAITPIWDKLRFHLKVPIIQSVKPTGESVLKFCKLRVDIYDQIDKTTKRLIGYLSFRTKDLVSLFENRDKHAQIKWLTIRTNADSIVNANNGIFESDDNSDDEDEDDEVTGSNSYESVSKLKVRGGYMGVDESGNTTVNEYILQIKSAHKLSNTDIFGGADAYVIVYWCCNEVGRTQVIAKSVDPIFSHEYFIILDHQFNNKIRTTTTTVRSLSLQVWSKLDNTKSVVFLGCVIIENEDLDLFFHPENKNNENDNQHEYVLKPSIELNEEENQLVNGSLVISSRLLTNFPINTVTRQEAILWIVSAKKLHNSSLFGSGSDVYFKVFRKYDLDSDEDHEIYKSKVVSQSLDPIFTDELVTVIVPCLTNWIDFTLRIELWDNYNVLLGSLDLVDKDAQAILQRSDEYKILQHLNYPLSSKFKDEVAPEIVLSGGLKRNFQCSWKEMKEAEAERLALLDINEPKDETTDDVDTAEITLVSLSNDTLITEDSKKQNKVKSTKYCAVSWNNLLVGKTDVIEAGWEEQSFQISVKKVNPFKTCSLTITVYDTSQRSKADGGDVSLGTFSITKEEELIKLFDPSIVLLSFPMKLLLKDGKNSENYVLTINGVIPRLQQSYDLIHNDDDLDLKTTEDNKEVAEQHIMLKILRATGLAQVNTLSRSTDSYAIIYWNDHNEPVGKTEVVSNSINPIFDCEKFDIIKKKGLKLNECQLRVALYNKNLLSSPTFLGEIMIANNDLYEFVFAEEVSREFILSKSSIEKSKQNYVQGSLELSCAILPDFSALPMFNYEIPISNDLFEVDIMVLSAFNLAINNNSKVSGDVYGNIEWGYSQLGSIPMINHALHTIWYDNQCFKIRLPKQWIQSSFLNEMVMSVEDEIMIPPQYHNVLKYMIVNINMYTTTHNGKEFFLGCVEINHEQLKEIMSTSFHHRGWYKLKQSTRLKAKDQSSVIQGEIQVLISYALPQSMISNNSKYTMDIKNYTIDISICSATLVHTMIHKVPEKKVDNNLEFNHDDIETYVYCRWNGRIVGKTYDESHAINPHWEDVNIHIKVPLYYPIESSILEFEVWQKSTNSDNKSSVFLIGVVEISNVNLKLLIETKDFKSVHHPIQIPTDIMTHNLLLNSIRNLIATQTSCHNNTIDLGQLELKYGSMNKNVHEDSDDIVPFEIVIFAAKDIYIMDKVMNTSDPFVICKWNRREIGRTKCITKTINPVWNTENFSIPIDPDSDLSGSVLQVEVWNQRFNKKGDFLGCLYYTGQKLQDIFNDLQISGRTWFQLEKSPIIPDDQQIDVKGQIEITIQPKQDRISVDSGGERSRSISSSLQSIVKWMQVRDRRAGKTSIIVEA
jgi:Ca2+-dependent lipid-binding protein